MNYVAIDPSLSCTAMVVNDKKFVYTTPTAAHTKKGELKGWFSDCEEFATIRVFDDLPDKLTHSELELKKLFHYDFIVQKIVQDVKANLKPDEPVTIGIEGYSYSSAAGPLIDLVTFSTLLRINLFQNMPGLLRSDKRMLEFKIFQPTEVKQRAAALTYPPIKKGKKVEYRNNDGIAGGSFKKPEIYKALIENSKLDNDEWVNFLKEEAEAILDKKSIPKPIEDLNDAKILYEILKAAEPLE